MPKVRKALLDITAAVAESGLEPLLVELVKVRTSQINGCAYCINMHSKDARKLGERDERLLLLDAWREAPCYTERERAALAWTEALTLVTEGHVPDAVHAEASAKFSDVELAHLTGAIVAINAWNWISIAYRLIPPVRAASA